MSQLQSEILYAVALLNMQGYAFKYLPLILLLTAGICDMILIYWYLSASSIIREQ